MDQSFVTKNYDFLLKEPLSKHAEHTTLMTVIAYNLYLESDYNRLFALLNKTTSLEL